jgi:hypothetical protein
VTNADDSLRAFRDAIAAAHAAQLSPVRVYNRLQDAVRAEGDRVAETPAGREALETAAFSDPDPSMRLSAAATVATWDRERAAEALETLVASRGETVTRPVTMTEAIRLDDRFAASAALCLYTLDRPVEAPRPARPLVPVTPVSTADLDAAEAVYHPAMNGGLDHAFDLAGDKFPAAARAFEAVGAPEAAEVLRRVAYLLGGDADLDDGPGISELNRRFFAMPDLMDRLEMANEV